MLEHSELVDVDANQSRPLIDAPTATTGGTQVAWSPDSRSVALSRTYLPLGDTRAAEREIRRAKLFAAEVNVASGQVTPIVAQENGAKELFGLEWNPRSGVLTAQTMHLVSQTFYELGKPALFRKRNEAWEAVPGSKMVQHPVTRIFIDQDMNRPPRLMSEEPLTNQKLMDLNPEFSDLLFGKVEEIHWQGSDGHDVKGGLYYPVNYQTGKRYPLVVQTHGWTADEFGIDGADTSGYAAQALAGHGILVLQADDSNWMTAGVVADETRREMAAYEGAIDELDRRGLIDRDKVGILGFSRTCWFVKYTLTHSTYRFAAAAIVDGIDGGYYQYITAGNASPDNTRQFEKGNGDAPPYGKGLSAWLQSSPGFNVDRVTTPIRFMPLNPLSILGEWEWFTLLSRMKKPADMVVLEDGSHQLTKPWDRMAAQEGNEEWFRFWLKGEENPDPAKTEQYIRWRELRKLQRAQDAERANASKDAPKAH